MSVGQELAALGARPPIIPELVWPGVHHFTATIPNASTAEQDLTAAAAQIDQGLIQRFMNGTAVANPQMVAQFETLKISVADGALTEAVLQQVFQRLYLRHQAGNNNIYISLGNYVSSQLPTVSEGNAALKYSFGNSGYFELPFPIIVDFEVDTLSTAVHTAVATGGQVISVSFGGFVWSKSRGVPDPKRCPDAQELALMRAAQIAPGTLGTLQQYITGAGG